MPVQRLDALYHVWTDNLQGVKIDRPAPGTICIRVIGKKAQKVLVK